MGNGWGSHKTCEKLAGLVSMPGQNSLLVHSSSHSQDSLEKTFWVKLPCSSLTVTVKQLPCYALHMVHTFWKLSENCTIKMGKKEKIDSNERGNRDKISGCGSESFIVDFQYTLGKQYDIGYFWKILFSSPLWVLLKTPWSSMTRSPGYKGSLHESRVLEHLPSTTYTPSQSWTIFVGQRAMPAQDPYYPFWSVIQVQKTPKFLIQVALSLLPGSVRNSSLGLFFQGQTVLVCTSWPEGWPRW